MMGFGLQHSTSWTRDNATNNFLYDGGSELNTTTSLYDLPYRNYDPTLGRFFQVDPMAHVDHNLTPYHYSRNNPLGFSDPSGALEDSEFIGAEDGEWSMDQTTSSEGGGGGEGGGGDSGNNGQVTVHGAVDNLDGTTTYAVTGADGQGYVVTLNNDDHSVVSAQNADAFDAGNTMGANGSTLVNNGDGTGTGVSWSTGGGQFTMSVANGQLTSSGTGISGGTLNSTSYSLSGNSGNGAGGPSDWNNFWNAYDNFGDAMSSFASIPALAAGVTRWNMAGGLVRGGKDFTQLRSVVKSADFKSLKQFTKTLGGVGKVLGITGVVTSAGVLWTDPNWTNAAKFAINVGALGLKSNPLGLTISFGIGLLDYTGILDKGLNWAFNENTTGQ